MNIKRLLRHSIGVRQFTKPTWWKLWESPKELPVRWLKADEASYIGRGPDGLKDRGTFVRTLTADEVDGELTNPKGMDALPCHVWPCGYGSPQDHGSRVVQPLLVTAGDLYRGRLLLSVTDGIKDGVSMAEASRPALFLPKADGVTERTDIETGKKLRGTLYPLRWLRQGLLWISRGSERG